MVLHHGEFVVHVHFVTHAKGQGRDCPGHRLTLFLLLSRRCSNFDLINLVKSCWFVSELLLLYDVFVECGLWLGVETTDHIRW